MWSTGIFPSTAAELGIASEPPFGEERVWDPAEERHE
jgi:hypothetical protein